ncbi:MAG: ABC transporter permease [Pikeienuella sp.]
MRLEPRRESSRLMLWATPVIAVALTIIVGMGLFELIGKDSVKAIWYIFVEPLTNPYLRPELLIKGTPLVLIAIGLSLGFRAGVWNIGAEGQFIMGAIAGGSVALAFYDVEGMWLLPLMGLAGAAGGAAWAMIPAFLRIKANANEILVSLMLVYVASLFLSAMVSGPLRDPDGFNFPESRLFHDSALMPILIPGSNANIGVIIALGIVVAAYVLLQKHIFGFQVKLFGQAPRAARFAGFSDARVIAVCLGISGGLAGLSGMFEVAGPVGQLVPGFPIGYGFTAIIVAFLGRLHPVGIVFAGAIMALTYVGGQEAQLHVGLPGAAVNVFQGMLLFFLLGVDVLVNYRVRFGARKVA